MFVLKIRLVLLITDQQEHHLQDITGLQVQALIEVEVHLEQPEHRLILLIDQVHLALDLAIHL